MSLEHLRDKSVFAIASQSLRQILRYLHRELKMPREMIETQVKGILHSFAIEDVYEQENKRGDP